MMRPTVPSKHAALRDKLFNSKLNSILINSLRELKSFQLRLCLSAAPIFQCIMYLIFFSHKNTLSIKVDENFCRLAWLIHLCRAGQQTDRFRTGEL